MFEEFYEMYESEEQEVVALINRCIGGGYNWKGKFWEMTVVTLGIMFCDTGEVSTKEERLDWSVTDEDRNGEKGWGRFRNEQICRLKIRRMKEEWAKDLVARPWCISEVIKPYEDCPELLAILDERNKPVIIEDKVLGILQLNRDFDIFEGAVSWCSMEVILSLEVNPESKSSWSRARTAAKKLVVDMENWNKSMREFAANELTQYLQSLPAVQTLPNLELLCDLYAIKLYELHKLNDLSALSHSNLHYFAASLIADKLSAGRLAEAVMAIPNLKGAALERVDRSGQRYSQIQKAFSDAGKSALLCKEISNLTTWLSL